MGLVITIKASYISKTTIILLELCTKVANEIKLNQNKKYTETHIIIAFCFNSNY